jgi:hypothetical protein
MSQSRRASFLYIFLKSSLLPLSTHILQGASAIENRMTTSAEKITDGQTFIQLYPFLERDTV